MVGLSRATGAAIDDIAHIRQSVADILTTLVGSRLCRRSYGSLLPELIDQPLSPANILRLYAATAVALSRHEPRLRLRRVHLATGARPGAATLTIDAVRTAGPAASAALRLFIPL